MINVVESATTSLLNSPELPSAGAHINALTMNALVIATVCQHSALFYFPVASFRGVAAITSQHALAWSSPDLHMRVACSSCMAFASLPVAHHLVPCVHSLLRIRAVTCVSERFLLFPAAAFHHHYATRDERR